MLTVGDVDCDISATHYKIYFFNIQFHIYSILYCIRSGNEYAFKLFRLKCISCLLTTMPLKTNATLDNEHKINTSLMQHINLQFVLLVH